jgi:hypothetical protein
MCSTLGAPKNKHYAGGADLRWRDDNTSMEPPHAVAAEDVAFFEIGNAKQPACDRLLSVGLSSHAAASRALSLKMLWVAG